MTERRRTVQVGLNTSDESDRERGVAMARGRKESIPTIYEMRINGHLDKRWTDRFGGMTFTHESDGTTTLCGPLADQAALHGLPDGIRDLGLALISVQQMSPNREERKKNPNKTARITGLLYVLMMPLGLLGIMYVPTVLVVAGDAVTTTKNIMVNIGR
jgi:hypothetical protein